jgi:ABC-2 type transport system ATP-binding protein
MDEAQALADGVAVISAGRIVAAGTPDDLGGRERSPSLITFDASEGSLTADLREAVGGVWGGEAGRVTLRTTEPVRTMHELTARALRDGIELASLEVRRPSLEDIYLELTDAGRDQ